MNATGKKDVANYPRGKSSFNRIDPVWAQKQYFVTTISTSPHLPPSSNNPAPTRARPAPETKQHKHKACPRWQNERVRIENKIPTKISKTNLEKSKTHSKNLYKFIDTWRKVTSPTLFR